MTDEGVVEERPLFDGVVVVKPPVRAWLDRWNLYLVKLRLPTLSRKDCAAFGKLLTALWELRGRETDLIYALMATWFERLDSWPQTTGFAWKAFMQWVPKALVQMDAAETKRFSDAAKKAREARRLKELTEAPPDAVPTDVAKERIAEMRRMIALGRKEA